MGHEVVLFTIHSWIDAPKCVTVVTFGQAAGSACCCCAGFPVKVSLFGALLVLLKNCEKNPLVKIKGFRGILPSRLPKNASRLRAVEILSDFLALVYAPRVF